jgi:hypothetical protein
VTVNSDVGDRLSGLPTEIHADGVSVIDMFGGLGTDGTNGKRFKIFVVPNQERGFESFCFQLIGQGGSFCTARHCATSHHHASIKAVKPGEIYIAKSSGTAFVTPSLQTGTMDSAAEADWSSLNLTLSAWNDKFLAAMTSSDVVPTSLAGIEMQEEFFKTKALNFKTPAKKRRSTEEEGDASSLQLEVALYSPFFRPDEAVPITEIEQVSGVLARLDQGVGNNNSALVSLVGDYRTEHGKAAEAIEALWLRVESLSGTVGRCPDNLAMDYLAPSAWGSIGAIATQLDIVGLSVTTQASKLDNFQTENLLSMEDLSRLNREDFLRRLESFKTAFIGVSKGLGGRLDIVELSLHESNDLERQADAASLISRAYQPIEQTVDRLSRGMPALPTRDQAYEDYSTELSARMETRMVDLESKMGGLVAKNDERAIKFAGLGFQSFPAACAWLETELPNHPCGLIVDAHMVFEHIHYAIEGVDTIATMEKLYKIKVASIADSVAMTSYDVKTPKFFCKNQGHRVLKGDASYLDAVPSHSDWSDVGTGYKMKLQEALAEFQESHGTFIDQAVVVGSKPHTLAHAALTESVAWIIGFIQFMDEYYRELSKAKFGSGKAWHVTTRLAKRILDDVGTPRYGVQNAFRVGDSTQICQQIFWSVLKSHDVMTSYKRMNFKNHPSVATELVKFLAINTSFEAIEKLTGLVTKHEVELADTKKQLAAAVKASATAANKADDVKKLIDALDKRVKKLE